MSPDALSRAARQLALPQIGLDGQQRIAAATVAIVGDDLAAEVVARAVAAAGVGRLRLVRRRGALPPVVSAAIAGSNPDVQIETRAWPAQGAEWVLALDGVTAVVRSGFDDDPMLRAAVRAALPVVVMRGRDDDGGIDVVSFRRQGPCPHAPLEMPERTGAPAEDGAGAVVAAHIAAAEVLLLLAGATTGEGRARHVRIPLPTASGGGDGDRGAALDVRVTDIPWSPECFVCGGSGAEMSFS